MKNSHNLPQEEMVALYRNALMNGVSFDEVDHKVQRHLKRLMTAEQVETGQAEATVVQEEKSYPSLVRWGALVLPLLFIAFGMYLVSSAAIPIAGYYLNDIATLRSSSLRAPVPANQVIDSTPIVITQVQAESASSSSLVAQNPIIINEELDYTNLSNWFDPATITNLEFKEPADSLPATYTLDIPKLDVTNAEVAVGGTDLNKSLIAYPGTAKPGEFGAPVIFGHSVLRQFYNPSEKNPRRYNSIFSKIMTLKPGDEIFVTYDNVKYTYVVQELTEVSPEEVSILAQHYDAKRLKLVTCTPEGTYLRRGIVSAQLVKTGS